MRVLFTFFFIFFSLCSGFSQNDTISQAMDKNELRINPFSFIVSNGFEVDYEYLFKQQSSLGIGVFVKLGEANDFDLVRNFSFTPYYRQYFSKRYARGFFVEGFGTIINREDILFNFNTNNDERRSQTDVALGISVGGKFLTRGGFVAEVFAGVGRTLGSNDDFLFENIIGRGGIALGYRF